MVTRGAIVWAEGKAPSPGLGAMPFAVGGGGCTTSDSLQKRTQADKRAMHRGAEEATPAPTLGKGGEENEPQGPGSA